MAEYSGGLQLQLLTRKGAGGMDGCWLQRRLQLLAVCPFTDRRCPGKHRDLCAARLQSTAGAARLVYVIYGVPCIPKIHSACNHAQASIKGLPGVDAGLGLHMLKQSKGCTEPTEGQTSQSRLMTLCQTHWKATHL